MSRPKIKIVLIGSEVYPAPEGWTHAIVWDAEGPFSCSHPRFEAYIAAGDLDAVLAFAKACVPAGCGGEVFAQDVDSPTEYYGLELHRIMSDGRFLHMDEDGLPIEEKGEAA